MANHFDSIYWKKTTKQNVWIWICLFMFLEMNNVELIAALLPRVVHTIEHHHSRNSALALLIALRATCRALRSAADSHSISLWKQMFSVLVRTPVRSFIFEKEIFFMFWIEFADEKSKWRHEKRELAQQSCLLNWAGEQSLLWCISWLDFIYTKRIAFHIPIVILWRCLVRLVRLWSALEPNECCNWKQGNGLARVIDIWEPIQDTTLCVLDCPMYGIYLVEEFHR